MAYESDRNPFAGTDWLKDLDAVGLLPKKGSTPREIDTRIEATMLSKDLEIARSVGSKAAEVTLEDFPELPKGSKEWRIAAYAAVNGAQLMLASLIEGGEVQGTLSEVAVQEGLRRLTEGGQDAA